MFVGRARNRDGELDVTALEFEAYPELCAAEGEALLAEARRLFPVRNAVLAHRSGMVPIGEAAIWIGVSSVHRDAAFRACRHLIDSVKISFPVWKKQHLAGGGSEWAEPHAATAASPAPVLPPGFSDRQSAPEIFGPEGQARLERSSILVVGAGGLGCPALRQLAGAGPRRLGVCDPGDVAVPDLHRQTLYGVEDVGESKAEIAARRLRRVNPACEIAVHPEGFVAADADSLLPGWDLILDCVDDQTVKLQINDAALRLGIPLVHAAVHHREGQVLLIDPADAGAGCLRCLWPRAGADAPRPAGALGPVTSVLGSLQALLALEYLAGARDLGGALRLLDLRDWSIRSVSLAADPGCPACAGRR